MEKKGNFETPRVIKITPNYCSSICQRIIFISHLRAVIQQFTFNIPDHLRFCSHISDTHHKRYQFDSEIRAFVAFPIMHTFGIRFLIGRGK